MRKCVYPSTLNVIDYYNISNGEESSHLSGAYGFALVQTNPPIIAVHVYVCLGSAEGSK